MMTRCGGEVDKSPVDESYTSFEERTPSNVLLDGCPFGGIGPLDILMLKLKNHIDTSLGVVVHTSR